jgi:uncharacterized membrane protein
MNKESYLAQIRQLLQSLPEEDRERSLAFYAESIDDRIEDGMSEEEAVASLESPEEAAQTILMNMPIPKLVKARVKQRRMGAVEILLLVLGFPLWFPLLLTILILGLTAYLLVWTLVLVLAAVVLALGLSAVAGVIAAVYFIIKAGLPLFLLSLGAALVLTGLAVLFGFAAAGMGRLAVKLGKAMVRGLKSLLIRKEDKA